MTPVLREILFRPRVAPAPPFLHLGVSFTQDVAMEYAAAALTDADNAVFSFKIRGCGGEANQTIGDDRGLLGVLFGSCGQDATHNAEQIAGWAALMDNSLGNNGGGVVRSTAGDTSIKTNGGFLAAFAPLVANIRNMEWFTISGAVGVNHANGAKLGALAIDGLPVTLFAEGGTWGAGSLALSAFKFMINIWSVAGSQSMADFDCARAYFATPASLTGILNPSPTGLSDAFATGFLAKEYVAGVGSVDIGTNGSGWTGAQPLIFHEVRPGGAATDFLTNRGTLVATPTLSNMSGSTNTSTKALYLASAQPNETGAQPVLAWLPMDAARALTESVTVGATSTDDLQDNYGQEIRVNDLMVEMFCSGGTGQRTGVAISSVNGGNWTKLVDQGATGDDFAIFIRTATSADVTAQGQLWNANTKPLLTWTSKGGFGGGGANATRMSFVIRKPNGAAVTATAGTVVKQTPSVASPWLAPAMTPAAAPAMLHDYIKAYGWQYEGYLAQDATMIPRFKREDDPGNLPHDRGGAYPRILERRCLSTSAIAQRTHTTSLTGNAGVLIPVMYS